MTNPFFTIIIPTLNEEQFLPKLLADLKKQKEKNFEIIVIDASSGDKTKELALNFKTLPLSFYEVETQSVSYQKNYGAKLAKGKYLIFLDADIRISTTFTKKLKASILRTKGLIFIPYIIPNEGYSKSKIIFGVINLLVEFSQNISKPFSSGGSMVLEKNFFYLLGGFNEKLFLSEDHNIVQRAYLFGVRSRFLPQVVVKVSLRRMKKEGELTALYKYLFATAHILLKGDINKKLFEYQMGGKGYKNLKKKLTIDQLLTKYLKQVKQFFRDNLSEV